MTTAQDQQSRTELLPCPFCGGAASAHEVDPRGAPGWFHLTVRHRDGCLHRPSKEILLLNADDLERWNRRAPAEQAARALPARGVDARLDTPAGLEPDFFLDGGTLPCFYASTVLAMGRVPPGWQAVPVEPSGDMLVAIMSAGEVDVLRETPEKHQVLLIDRAGIPERYANLLAAAPQPPAAPATTEPQAPTTGALQPHEQLTDAEIIHALETRRRQSDFYQSHIGLACTQCTDGKYRADSNGYNAFHRCDKCLHVPMWMEGSTELVAPIK